MRYTQIITTIQFAMLLALGSFVVWQSLQKKHAYVLNQEVFNGFKGKQFLESELVAHRARHKASMDSLLLLMEAGNTMRLQEAYAATGEQFALMEQELSGKFTADIWKEINSGITAYGKDHGYDFILGASGDGGLMFASEATNITDDVVDYLNERYEAR
jgi:outer membrane protein